MLPSLLTTCFCCPSPYQENTASFFFPCFPLKEREGGFSFTNIPSKDYAFLSLLDELTMPGKGTLSPTALAHAPHIPSSSGSLSEVEMQHTAYKPKQMLCNRFYGSSLLLSLGPEAVLPTHLPLIGELPEADGKALQCQVFEGHS